jgi:AraC family transcriptional regulator
MWTTWQEKASGAHLMIQTKSYGIEFYTQEFFEDRKWFYMACKEVKDLSYVPITIVGKSIPAHKYLVFSCRGGVAEIVNTLQSAYHEWLPSSGYVVEERFDFELYDERFKGPNHPETVIDLYVPIRKEE